MKEVSFRKFLILTAIAILLLFTNLIPAVNIFKNIYMSIVFPVARLAYYPEYGYKNISERIASIRNIYKENMKLKNKMNKYKEEYKDYELIKKRLDYYKGILGYEREAAPSLMPARVMFHAPENYFTQFTVSRGENDGVSKDDAVVYFNEYDWVLAGRVGRVYENYSSVVLITSHAFRCGARLESGDRGVIEGRNGWLLNMNYISPDARVDKGDRVYTSKTGGVIPGNLLIGTVIDVDVLDFSKGQVAEVMPAVYPQNAEVVYIICN